MIASLSEAGMTDSNCFTYYETPMEGCQEARYVKI